MTTWKQSHPWLTFSLDLRRASYRLWLLLGEAQSKIDHVAGTLLKPGLEQHFMELYLAKGVRATTAIEGNTLTEDQVLRRIQGELELPESQAYLGREIDNVIEACNSIGQQILDSRLPVLGPEEICDYNRQVLAGLSHEEGVVPGELRRIEVGVGRYRGAPARDLEPLMARLCNWLAGDFRPPQERDAMAFAILQAVVAHLYLAWVHPFGDGNGRTARLMEFHLLLAAGAPTITAHLLSNHYNLTRSEYYRQLDQASKSQDPFPFIEYAVQGLVDGLAEQITKIRGQQLLVHWINFIHETFRDRDGAAWVRRRRLALDLSSALEPVPLDRLRHLSPRLAESYANLTPRTLRRDVGFLVENQLARLSKGGVRANIERMIAFQPLRASRVPSED